VRKTKAGLYTERSAVVEDVFTGKPEKQEGEEVHFLHSGVPAQKVGEKKIK